MNGKAIAIQTTPRSAALKPVPMETLFERIVRVHQDIARRAFEIFETTEAFSVAIGITGSGRKPNCFTRCT